MQLTKKVGEFLKPNYKAFSFGAVKGKNGRSCFDTMYFNRLLLNESRTIIEIADRLYLQRHTKAAEYTVTELLQRVSLGIYIALKSVYNLDFDNS